MQKLFQEEKDLVILVKTKSKTPERLSNNPTKMVKLCEETNIEVGGEKLLSHSKEDMEIIRKKLF
jgi:ribosomal protein S10